MTVHGEPRTDRPEEARDDDTRIAARRPIGGSPRRWYSTESKGKLGTKLLDKLASPSQTIVRTGWIEKSWPVDRSTPPFAGV